jgi:outer membrane protein assembly factor BamA
MVFRGFAGYGDYDYSDQTLGPIDGDMTLIDAMIGYMFVRDSGSLAIYIGGEYQNHDLTPDDIANQIRGSEYGFKVAADISAARNGFYFELGGSYSTAFDSYYSQARIGLDRKRFVIGPEAGASGNKDYDAQRVGGFLTLKRHLNAYVPFDITLSGGYQFVSDGEGGVVSGTRGSQGGYGAVNFTATF